MSVLMFMETLNFEIGFPFPGHKWNFSQSLSGALTGNVPDTAVQEMQADEFFALLEEGDTAYYVPSEVPRCPCMQRTAYCTRCYPAVCK